jgi:hypothetical protein
MGNPDHDIQQNDGLTCSDCGCKVSEKDAFCPQCGGIFIQPIYCSHHASVEAEGVCVICRSAFCKECGGTINKLSLCQVHFRYETAEGMARVFGSEDNVQTQFVKSCLEQAGLHPFFFSRRYNPGPDMSQQFSWQLFPDYNVVELKLLVPFHEVLKAEKVLEELGMGDPNRVNA